MTAYHVVSLLTTILLPPCSLILMAGVGVALWRRRPVLARNLVAAALVLMWILSTAAFNVPFLEALAWPAPEKLDKASGAQAIVVLGGGISHKAPEYFGANTINSRTLDRVRYAAWLHRQTGLPILATGGPPGKTVPAESELMKSALENEFSTPVRWIEVEARTTFDNARGSARILREAGITRVYLVTHSGHMRRAVQAFAPTGIEVIPAPIEIFTRDPLGFQGFLPSPLGMSTNAAVLHELLGMAWYEIRARLQR